jgi:hypothetical protein
MANTPPKDVEASALFLKLIETPAPSDVIDFPRKGPDGKPIDQIRLLVLASEDHDRAREKATKYFLDKGYTAEQLKSLTIREVLSDRIAKEVLVYSCHTVAEQFTDSNDQPVYGKIFHSADDVGKLRAHGLTVLWNAYLLVQDKYGPYEHSVDVDAWVRRLTEGGQHFPLLSLDLPDLVNLTSSLAARVSTISHVLASQWATLPDTCQSALGRLISGTSSASGQPEKSEAETTESLVDLELVDAVQLAMKRRAQERLTDITDE